ncbi:MAG: sulfurtransferase TusA family protein [bacterium]
MFLDVRGETCPYPMQKTLEALERLPEGDELVVLVDHPPAIETIRMVADRYGFAMDVEPAGSGEWQIRLYRQTAQEVSTR